MRARTDDVDVLATAVLEAPRTTGCMLVAVSGIDGSGKGWVSSRLTGALSQRARAVSINIDAWLALPQQRFSEVQRAEHFYRHAIRFEAMFEQVVFPLRRDRSLHLEVELTGEFGTPFLQSYHFEDIDIIVLEGIFLLQHALRDHYDLSIWVDCSFETALQRALQRGQEALSPEETVREYERTFFPAQRFHFERDDPRGAADIIFVNDDALR